MTVQEIPISDEELRVLLETGYILREAAKFDDSETVFRGVMEFLPDSEVPQVGLRNGFSSARRFSNGRRDLPFGG